MSNPISASREWLLVEARAMSYNDLAVALAASSMPSTKSAAIKQGPDAWQDWAVEGLMKLGIQGVLANAKAERRAALQAMETDDWRAYNRMCGSARRHQTAVDMAFRAVGL